MARGAHLARDKPKSVLVATGHTRFAATGTMKLTIRLTRRGRRPLKHAKRLKLTAKGSFTPTGGRAIEARRTFTIKR